MATDDLYQHDRLVTRPAEAGPPGPPAGRFASPWPADIDDRAGAPGENRPHATRILAQIRLRVMWRCRQNDTSYDPALYDPALCGGARHHVEQSATARL